jgi:hypothetical protein
MYAVCCICISAYIYIALRKHYGRRVFKKKLNLKVKREKASLSKAARGPARGRGGCHSTPCVLCVGSTHGLGKKAASSKNSKSSRDTHTCTCRATLFSRQEKKSSAHAPHNGDAERLCRRTHGCRQQHKLACQAAARGRGPFGLHSGATRTMPHAKKPLHHSPHAQTQHPDTQKRDPVQSDRSPSGRTASRSSPEPGCT